MPRPDDTDSSPPSGPATAHAHQSPPKARRHIIMSSHRYQRRTRPGSQREPHPPTQLADAPDLDRAAPPLDTLLIGAAKGPVTRWLPGGSAVRLAVGPARKPDVLAGVLASLAAELDRVAAAGLVDDADCRDGKQIRFLTEYLIETLAPSSSPPLNPAAWKATLDTSGASMLRGIKAFVKDMAVPSRVPPTIEPDALKVGRSPAGGIVLRLGASTKSSCRPGDSGQRRHPWHHVHHHLAARPLSNRGAMMTDQSTVAGPSDAAQPVSAAPAATPGVTPTMADPTPVAFGLFAFALAVYGVRFVGIDVGSLLAPHTQLALDYALLIAGIAETLGGLLAILRGIAYPGWVTMVFGIWLLGFYLLLTNSRVALNADSVAWYVWILVVPVAILAVPAFAHRHLEFMIAFAAIAALLVLLGLAFHDVQNALDSTTAAGAAGPDPAKLAASIQSSSVLGLLRVSAWLGFVSAAAIWVAFARTVYAATGVIRSNTG